MPDLPEPKRRPSPWPGLKAPRAGGYAELHCRTNYTFLTGASHPDELVQRAAELDYTALAVTDVNSVAGVVRAHVAAKEAGLKLLVGAEVTPADAPPAVLLAMNREGYGRLCRLITAGRRRAPKGECHLTFEDVAEHGEGLLAGVILRGLKEDAVGRLREYREVFGDRAYGVAELHRGSDDGVLLARMQRHARSARLPLVAANDVHCHSPQRRYLQDVLTAVRERRTVADLGRRTHPNGERYLKSAEQMRALFAGCPDAVSRTLEVASRCAFSLDELKYQYPRELCPPGLTPIEHLTRLTWRGAAERYPGGVPEKVRGLIGHELRLIQQLGYEPYFLTVWDVARFARERRILHQGRGSAANSAVCYCLHVTAVDPERIDVLFERFVSAERGEPPDIDVDFEHERREEVLQYLYEKYGRDRCAMTAEVITYRPKSAVRDVGKALGLSPDALDRLASALDPRGDEHKIAERFRAAGFDPASRLARQLLHLVREILGFPRHLSQHVGGMVLTDDLLCELVPVENAAMENRTVIQWDKDDLDALRLLKVDVLGLGMLSAIRRCFELVARHHGRGLTLATVPAEDPAVYEMATRADTIGVFQIESEAQRATLPRLKPTCFYDLVISVALIRPGPIVGNMVHPLLRRRNHEEPVTFPDARIEAVLGKTLGVPLFQEQAMALAVTAAGFSPGEADQLRRAMAAWRRPGVIDRYRERFLGGMRANSYGGEFAAMVWKQIEGFGSYGFPESHSASFALLVYCSCWLKLHYPAAFCASLLNSQPMGFYAPAQLVIDARRHGVEVRPACVNGSEWDCTLEPAGGGAVALRLGLRMVKGLPRAAATHIVECRGGGPYRSPDDLARRTGLGSPVLQRLSRADAFRALALGRREALWHSLPAQEHPPLLAPAEDAEPTAPLPRLSAREEVAADYGTTGLTLRRHPFTFVRPHLDRRVLTAAQLAAAEADRRYTVAGLAIIRQRPSTARGVTFVTLEDETGVARLLIRPDVWERFRHGGAMAPALSARGVLQRSKEGVAMLLADQLTDLSALLAGVQTRSRDFR